MSVPASLSRALILSDRVYRWLLVAYPAEFRQRYGPEMAQVFRTCCRATYAAAGARGVACLWLPTLWDWFWTAAGERFSGLFRRSWVNYTRPWLTLSKLVTLSFFLVACLTTSFCFLEAEVFSSPSLFWEDTCGIEVSNQSGQTLRITPLDIRGGSPAVVRLYRGSGLLIPAFRQRDITIKSGDSMYLHLECSPDESAISAIYACDPEGECYVHTDRQYDSEPVRDKGVVTGYYGLYGFAFGTLDSLTRPDAAMEAAVQSSLEHDYTGLKYTLLCLVTVIALLGGFIGLVRVLR